MTSRTFACATLVLCSFLGAGLSPLEQEPDRWDEAQLKSALTELGYEPKELSEKKWEVKLSKGGFNVPVGAELSSSGNYVWLTARLGDKPSDEKASGLLRANGKIQPTQFYVTDKGHLMIGLTCENRALTNALLRKALEKVSDDVANTSAEWNK